MQDVTLSFSGLFAKNIMTFCTKNYLSQEILRIFTVHECNQ